MLERLARHPKVSMIDLCNEPEQISSAAADAYVAMIQEMAAKVHHANPQMQVSVGSRTSIDAAFWQRIAPPSWTPSFHWFAKIAPAQLPLDFVPSSILPNHSIASEVDASVGVANALAKLWKAGFKGGLFWALNSNDGYEFRGRNADEYDGWFRGQLAMAKIRK